MRKVFQWIMTVMVLALILTAISKASATSIEYPAGYTPYYNEHSAQALAKLVWREGRGLPSDTEKAAIMWCVINRVENGGYGNSLWEVLTSPRQFAYRSNTVVDPALYELAKDVLIRWDMERCGYTNVGRVLPKEYLYFTGDGQRNHFRAEYGSNRTWGWALQSPYES